MAAFIPGFLGVEINIWLRAGGAAAVFVIVYFFSPAHLVVQPGIGSNDGGVEPKPGNELVFVTESYRDTNKMPSAKEIYFTVWNRHPREKIRIGGFRLVELARIFLAGEIQHATDPRIADRAELVAFMQRDELLAKSIPLDVFRWFPCNGRETSCQWRPK